MSRTVSTFGITAGNAAFNFGPADTGEVTAFGARGPDPFTPGDLAAWLGFMRAAGVAGVVCLVSANELAEHRGSRRSLLAEYDEAFPLGALHQPLSACLLPAPRVLDAILERLAHADAVGERLVVHCSQGMVRTGLVLAAWLVAGRGVDPATALRRVVDVPGVVRDPLWAEHEGLVLAGEVESMLERTAGIHARRTG